MAEGTRRGVYGAGAASCLRITAIALSYTPLAKRAPKSAVALMVALVGCWVAVTGCWVELAGCWVALVGC